VTLFAISQPVLGAMALIGCAFLGVGLVKLRRAFRSAQIKGHS